MKFYYIFWLMIALSLAISFTNAIGVFSTTAYMSSPDVGYEISDINGTFENTTPMDDATSNTHWWTALAFVKDMAVNSFFIYSTMISVWHVPAPLAAVLQVILTISWAVFFIQLISRFAWRGLEG